MITSQCPSDRTFSFGSFVRSNCFGCYSAAPIGLYLLSVDLFDKLSRLLLHSVHRTVPSLSAILVVGSVRCYFAVSIGLYLPFRKILDRSHRRSSCRSPGRYRVDLEFPPALLVLCYGSTISFEPYIVNAKYNLFTFLFDNFAALSELYIQYMLFSRIIRQIIHYCPNTLSNPSRQRPYAP